MPLCWLALFAAITLLPSVAWALPQITGLSWDIQPNADGTFSCNEYKLALQYDQPEGQVESQSFGIELRRNGIYVANQSKYQNRIDPFHFSTFAMAHRVPGGVPFTFEARTINDKGEVSAWFGPVTLTRPNCKGQPLDGKNHRSHAYIFVSFADYADRIPFSVSQFRDELMLAKTRSGEELSIKDYLELVSYQSIELEETYHGWVTLPGDSLSYCTNPNESGRDRFSCDFARTGRDALALLEQEGKVINADTPIFIINGMGSAGWSGTGGAYLSASRLKSWGETRPLPYEVIIHELLHTTGLQHSSMYEDCKQGVAPTGLDRNLDPIGCTRTGYGVGVMGVTHDYEGLSGWHRRILGYLGPDREAKAQLDQRNRIEVFDLDLLAPSGPQLITFALDEERDHLPVGRRLFMEYTMPDSRLSFNVRNSSRPGLRVALRHSQDGQTPLREPRRMPDATVFYLRDVELAKAGDRASLPFLGIDLEVVERRSQSIVVDIIPRTLNCEPGVLDPTYTLTRKLYAEGKDAHIVERLVANNPDKDCPRREIRWNSSFSESRGDVDVYRSLVSGEPYRQEKNWPANLGLLSSPSLQSTVQLTSGEQRYTREATLIDPDAFRVSFRTGHTLPQGSPLPVTVTNTSTEPMTLTVRPADEQRSETKYLRFATHDFTLAPGEQKTVSPITTRPDARILGFAVRFLAVPIRIAIDMNGRPHSEYYTGFTMRRGRCDDGVQNLDEEDIDCGGASCEPCKKLPAPLSPPLGVLLLALANLGMVLRSRA